MAIAITTNSVVGVLVEATRGTSPTTGTYAAVPILEGSEFDPAVKQSTVFEINDGTRMKSSIVGGAHSVRARLNCALNYETGLQQLLRFALHSADWAGGVITAGANASYFFTIILKLELGGTDDYVILKGCEVASATIDMPLNGACTVQFEILGMSSAVESGATLAAAMGSGDATLGSLSGKNPFATGLTGADLTWNAVGSNVGSASLTINNGSVPKYAWGGSGASHVINTNLLTQGRFEKYYTDTAIADDALAETVRALAFVLVCSEGASEDVMTISCPSSKITSAPIADSAGSQSQQAEFTAQYNSGISSQIRITVA